MAGGLAAVLFDMDGTLVDSEKVWDIGLAELAASYGGQLSASARQAMVGTSGMVTMRILYDDLGLAWHDPAPGIAWLDQRVAQLFGQGLTWCGGAQRLLTMVRAAPLPTALVTSTSRALVEIALETLGRANFDTIVCGDEVDQRKPHPEPYLMAAAALGVPPSRCVAIEDSPVGVASALAAGCAVIAVPHDVRFAAPGAMTLTSLAEADLDLLRSLVGASTRLATT